MAAARLAELDRQIANLSRRILRLRKKEDLRRRRRELQNLFVYMHGGHNFDLTSHFHMARCTGSVSLEDAAAEVESLCANASVEELLALIQKPLVKLSERDCVLATRYIVGFHLWKWTKSQNDDFGVAPSRKMMVDQAKQYIPERLPAVVRRPFEQALKTPRAQRKFLAKFRSSFQCRLGHLPATSPMPLSEKQDKAAGRTI